MNVKTKDRRSFTALLRLMVSWIFNRISVLVHDEKVPLMLHLKSLEAGQLYLHVYGEEEN